VKQARPQKPKSDHRSEGELSCSDEEVQQKPAQPPGILKESKRLPIFKAQPSLQKSSATTGSTSVPSSPKVQAITDQLAKTSIQKAQVSDSCDSATQEKLLDEAMLQPLPQEASTDVGLAEAEALLDSPKKGEQEAVKRRPEPAQTRDPPCEFGSVDIRFQTGELIRLPDGSTTKNPNWVEPEIFAKPRGARPKTQPKSGDEPKPERAPSRVRFEEKHKEVSVSQAKRTRPDFEPDWELLANVDLPVLPESKDPFGEYARLFLPGVDECSGYGDVRFSEKLRGLESAKVRAFFHKIPDAGLYLLTTRNGRAHAYVVVSVPPGHKDADEAGDQHFNPMNWSTVTEVLDVTEPPFDLCRYVAISFPPQMGEYRLTKTPLNPKNSCIRVDFVQVAKVFGRSDTVRFVPK
jgi:hypothetical protein